MKEYLLTSVSHTSQCLYWQEASQREQKAFWSTYPHACPTCRGWGMISGTYDPSPSGVGLSSGSITDSDPCSVCVEEGICPLCGEQALDEEGNSCLACSWICGVTEGAPQKYDACACWDLFLKQQEREQRYWEEVIREVKAVW